MLSVGATDSSDAVSVWSGTVGSNTGFLNVDIFAPGTGIRSTYWKSATNTTPPAGYIPVAGSSTQGYVALNGTSMAAPQVAAAVALVRMWQSAQSDLNARQIVIDQADVIASLNGKCRSGGRLNVAKMVDTLYQPILVSSGGGTGGGSTTISQALQAGRSIAGRLAISKYHTLFVDHGEAWAWGDNSQGELGNGTKNRCNSASLFALNETRTNSLSLRNQTHPRQR